MKLNNATEVSTINNENILLVSGSGVPLQISLINLYRQLFKLWSRIKIGANSEIDLSVSNYGLYLVTCSELGATALYLIGADRLSTMITSDSRFFSTNFDDTGKLILGKKETNGNIFFKNAGTAIFTVSIMRVSIL